MPQLRETKWPRSAPTAEPGLPARSGPRWPRAAGRGGGAAARARHPVPHSPRAGPARHSQSASSAHSRAGRGAGILSVASSAAAAARADPHGEGVPTEEPPLSPLPPPLLRLAAARCAPELGPIASAARAARQPVPGRRLGRRPKFACNFLGCAAKQPRVSFRLGRLLPPQAPPPVAGQGPAAFGTQGFPAGRSAGPGRARRDLRRAWGAPPPPAPPPPRRLPRLPTRSGSARAAAPRWARPLPKAVGGRQDAELQARGSPRS